MKLKGTMSIELTDVNTQKTETIAKENMVTNAINHILGLNPMAVFYAEDDINHGVTWTDTLLPICPNIIGGILLFSKALEENADNLYVSSGNLPVAYASNNVNSTANLARGSLNLTESKALENGYKFVWEFTPSQGNGTIAAVALTSAQGGENGFGSLIEDTSAFLLIKRIELDKLSTEKQSILFETVEVAFEHDTLYSITLENTSIRIRKVRIPIFSIGLNEQINDTTYSIIEDKVIPVSSFHFLGSYTLYGTFLDGQDGYWYGFSNNKNTSGDATMLWAKISKTDYSVEEGSWTLSNAHLLAVGEKPKDASYPELVRNCCIRDGFLYVPAAEKTGIYKINLRNSADITLIPFGFTSNGKPICESGTCELYLALLGDLIIGGDYQITANDTVIRTKGTPKLNSAATPLFQYKQFLLSWGGSYGKEYRNMYLFMPYLATINNLTSAVIKTTDKTMKITYTLTQEE